jgi:hypothetical protein
MLRALSLVLAVAVGTGLSTAPAAALSPKELKQITDILKPPPKSPLARAADIIVWSTPILSAIGSICFAWEPCDDTVASVAATFHFKYHTDRHRQSENQTVTAPF